jgi:hypothetical protein
VEKFNKWLEPKFTLESKIEWTCPSCNSKSLKIDKDRFYFELTANSKIDHEHEDWEPEWDKYNFIGFLRCTNELCKEIISFSGYGNIEVTGYEYDYEAEQDFPIYETCFIPQYFKPTPFAFQITLSCPYKIKEEIIKSFSLFWIDVSASANRLRIAIELIMEDCGVTTGHSLNKKIDKFKETEPELANYFRAIKWIGNTGSHEADSLKKQDLIDAFEILELALEKLYDSRDREEKVANISNEINSIKKPRSQRI